MTLTPHESKQSNSTQQLKKNYKYFSIYYPLKIFLYLHQTLWPKGS